MSGRTILPGGGAHAMYRGDDGELFRVEVVAWYISAAGHAVPMVPDEDRARGSFLRRADSWPNFEKVI